MTRDISLRILFTIIVAILIFALHRAITVGPRPAHPALSSPTPLLFAHRGGAALRPENTLTAFRNALTYEADVLELDVRLTADDYLVVMHDKTLDRTTDGAGNVRDHTLAELKQLDAGYRFTRDDGATYPYRGQGVTIPTLSEVLAEFPDQLINIEIKDNDKLAAEKLAAVIADAGASQRVIVVSFHDDIINYFRHLAPDVATAAGPGETRTFYLLSKLHLWRFHRPLSDAYQIPPTSGKAVLTSPSFIANAHKLNQKVHYWTIDDPEQMRALLQLGADGIMTDRPDLALQVFREYGLK